MGTAADYLSSSAILLSPDSGFPGTHFYISSRPRLPDLAFFYHNHSHIRTYHLISTSTTTNHSHINSCTHDANLPQSTPKPTPHPNPKSNP